jgi:hypothetical protein
VSYQPIIARLRVLTVPDRLLDATITARVLGPTGCRVDPEPYLDGHDIEITSLSGGDHGYWREAADVGHLTYSIEDAVAFVAEARKQDGAAIVSRALSSAPAGLSLGEFTQRLACSMMAELLESSKPSRQTQLRHSVMRPKR